MGAVVDGDVRGLSAVELERRLAGLERAAARIAAEQVAATAELQTVATIADAEQRQASSGGDGTTIPSRPSRVKGLVMGTRSGDLDPGVLTHLRRHAGMGADEIDTLLNRRSGLVGLCGVNDFRELRERIDGGDTDAALAYDVYIRRLRKYLGAYMIGLGRVDTITFTAGVGENADSVRADTCAHLENYGIVIDPDRNAVRSREPRVISAESSAVTVLVVPTNEELAIARATAELAARSR